MYFSDALRKWNRDISSSILHCTFCKWSFGQQTYCCGSAASTPLRLKATWSFSFLKNQKSYRGTSFWNCGQRQQGCNQLKAVSIEEFQHRCQEREHRPRRCIASQGNYFEGYLIIRGIIIFIKWHINIFVSLLLFRNIYIRFRINFEFHQYNHENQLPVQC